MQDQSEPDTEDGEKGRQPGRVCFCATGSGKEMGGLLPACSHLDFNPVRPTPNCDSQESNTKTLHVLNLGVI